MNLKLKSRWLRNSSQWLNNIVRSMNVAPNWSKSKTKTIAGFMLLVSIGLTTAIAVPAMSKDITELKPTELKPVDLAQEIRSCYYNLATGSDSLSRVWRH
jgi:hypothetical protein